MRIVSDLIWFSVFLFKELYKSFVDMIYCKILSHNQFQWQWLYPVINKF